MEDMPRMDGSGRGTDGISDLERAAMNQEAMPVYLQAHDQVKFLGLRYLYGSYKRKIIPREQASAEKKKFLAAWDKVQESWAFEKKCWENSAKRTLAAERAMSMYRKDRTLENADALVERLEWISDEGSRRVILTERGADCPNCGKPFEQSHADCRPAYCEDCGCRLDWEAP